MSRATQAAPGDGLLRQARKESAAERAAATSTGSVYGVHCHSITGVSLYFHVVASRGRGVRAGMFHVCALGNLYRVLAPKP